MYRFYSCIYLISIICFQGCKQTSPDAPAPKDTNNKKAPLSTPSSNARPKPAKTPARTPEGAPDKPLTQAPTTKPLASGPTAPPVKLETVLKDMSESLVDWRKNQNKFKQEIEALEHVAHPFSIEDAWGVKKTVDDTLLIRLALLSDKTTFDEIKKNLPFALDIIVLIKSLIDIADIPKHLEKDIKSIREKLLIDPTIKTAYYRLLAQKSDPKKILAIYAQKSNLDLKIYNTSPYDSPHNFVTNPINWNIKRKLGDMNFTQYPALNQQISLADPTNYCGYYAIYNASVLDNPISLPKLSDREAFKKFFESNLEIIKQARIDSSSTDTSEDDILRLSHLEHVELLELTASSKVDIKNLDLTSDFMATVTDDNAGIIIPDIIKHFLDINKLADNTDRQVFVGNTSANGSHWFAFSLEKKNGILIVNLADSLGQNRQKMFENWFPAL